MFKSIIFVNILIRCRCVGVRYAPDKSFARVSSARTRAPRTREGQRMQISPTRRDAPVERIPRRAGKHATYALRRGSLQPQPQQFLSTDGSGQSAAAVRTHSASTTTSARFRGAFSIREITECETTFGNQRSSATFWAFLTQNKISNVHNHYTNSNIPYARIYFDGKLKQSVT